MKRCITPHHVTSFGAIPVGSLWADDSPFLTDENAGYFVDVDDSPPEPPAPKKKKAAARKFGQKAQDD